MSDNLREACQILNSSLCQPGFQHEKKDWAVQFLQHAWLKNSARKAANPKDVEKFLDVLENYSRQLLHKVVNFCDENVSLSSWVYTDSFNFIIDINDCRRTQPYTTLYLMEVLTLSAYC